MKKMTLDYIIHENFLKLLRCGAFHEKSPLVPMSPWKWNKLYQLAVIHNVTTYIYNGICQCDDDFFLQIPHEQMETWRYVSMKSDTHKALAEYQSEKLTNPLINRKLQQIIHNEPNTPTRQLLIYIIGVARHILTEGISLRQITELGSYIRNYKEGVDNELLKKWLKELKMGRISQLEGELLVKLFGFSPEEIHFTTIIPQKIKKNLENEVFRLTGNHADDWYFTQGQSVFVTSRNTEALVWHVRHSIRYMPYYPGEAVTNFFVNFALSLSHIEE